MKALSETDVVETWLVGKVWHRRAVDSVLILRDARGRKTICPDGLKRSL